MNGWRFALFLTMALGIWALLHLYVFQRIATVPWVHQHLPGPSLALIAALLWASYPLARLLGARHWINIAQPLEYLAATWIGALFLLFAAFLTVDILTGAGLWLRAWVPTLRSGAILVAGVLSGLAIIQGLRPPVVRDYEVPLAGLPRQHDGLVLVAISDVHLGTLIHQDWLEKRIAQIRALNPDLIAIVGDLIDHRVDHVEVLLPVLQTLRAPLGVWAVTGNHEFYAGVDSSARLLEQAGYQVLRDRWARVAPGLMIAGVDDLTTRQQFGLAGGIEHFVTTPRPAGATILLSHTPWQAETVAKTGFGLMLSGHTHGGQIWPFNYLVGLRYRHVAGRYSIHGMSLIVCRGTGTWGPRMRLWQPSEILRITLRATGA
jgi:hypothetical protein